jgi:hypothetical protein
MPSFSYGGVSDEREIVFHFGLFHYLTVMLSNCTYNGNVFVSNLEDVEALIRTEFLKITNLELRGVGSSMVRGQTDSLTLGISAGFFSDVANLTESEALSLRVASNEAISNVSGLIVSEVRVETTLIQESTF